MDPASCLLLLGFGDAARAVLRAGGGHGRVVASTRRPDRTAEIRAAGAEVLVAPALESGLVAPLAAGADVLVSFPPDGVTDAQVAAGLGQARRVVYVSSTGVYGDRRGVIDDGTPVDPLAPRAGPRLAAEDAYRAAGAIVLRAPGLYGVGTGLHERLRAGTYRVPGDGQNCISRLHLDDLATLVLAAFARGRPGETYVVGDLAPVPQIEVVRFLCERLGVPVPPSLPLAEVSPTLRGDRQVDPSRALRDLGVTLRYPTYREGFAACLGATQPDGGE
jgi:nucleoside-diphosphate-sugar epimerase